MNRWDGDQSLSRKVYRARSRDTLAEQSYKQLQVVQVDEIENFSDNIKNV